MLTPADDLCGTIMRFHFDMREVSFGGTVAGGSEGTVVGFGVAEDGPAGTAESFLSNGGPWRRISRS